MPIYHAYASRAYLGEGTIVLVTGGSEPIEMTTGDQLSIEAPEYNRFEAVVLDQSDDRLLISLSDNSRLWLTPSRDEVAFDAFKISDGFSRQQWIVSRRA